jgi:arabinan endo-1,5-alpha-L-arabinosidase
MRATGSGGGRDGVAGLDAGGSQSAGVAGGAGVSTNAAGGAGQAAVGAAGAGGVDGAGAATSAAGVGADSAGGRATGGAGRAGGTNGGAGAGGRATVGGRGGSGSGGAAGAPSGGGGASAGGATAVSCPRLDPQNPPAQLALSGSLGTHDPSLIAAGGEFYLFQTGTRLPTKTSPDLMHWQAGSPVFSANPGWIATQVPAATDLWAPDISYFGGSYHLYYAASSFGSNSSCIGHATRATLDAGTWSDHGSVVCSSSSDDWNAIDPNVIVDAAGTPWLAFGSFWGGIKLLELDATGAPTGSDLRSLAARPHAGGALEGAYIVNVCGYYYLFVSWDHCCDSPFNYNVRVGRSTSVSGPYSDRDGTALLDGGGTLVVAGNDTWTAPGHNAVIVTASGAYNVYHALDANHANPTLRVAEIAWDADGWPVSAGP